MAQRNQLVVETKVDGDPAINGYVVADNGPIKTFNGALGEHSSSPGQEHLESVSKEVCKHHNSSLLRELSSSQSSILYSIKNVASSFKQRSDVFFQSFGTMVGSVILVVGNPGVGKTSLACAASCGWAEYVEKKCFECEASGLRAAIGQHLSKYHLVLYVPLNGVDFTKNNYDSIEDMALLAGIQSQHILKSALMHAKERLLIILDGWDELCKNCKTKEDGDRLKNCIFAKIVSRNTLHQATVLILTRPIGVYSLKELAKVTHEFELDGFVEEDIKEYVLETVGTRSKVKLLEHFNYFKPLLELCQVPLFCMTLIKVYTGRRSTVPITTTEILLKFTLAAINHALKHNQRDREREIQELADLSEDLLENFHRICQLALADITMKHSETGGLETSHDKTRLCSIFLLNVGIGSLEDLNDLCLYEPAILNDAHHYIFHHLTIQEFLASLAIQQKPPVNQLYFLKRHLYTLTFEHENLFLFYFGLTALDIQSSSSLDTTKLSLPTTLQLLACLKDSPDDRDVKRVALQDVLFLSNCIKEAQDLSLWKKLLRIENRRLEILLGERKLELHEIEAVVDMVANSGIKQWKIQAPERFRNFAVNLQDEINKKNDTYKVSVQHSTTFTLTPSSQSRSRSRESPCKISTHMLCIKSLRNIFHRVLQLNAPTRLKSDGNNPSYISFLCCKCLQEKFERCYEIKPIHAIHWLPGPKLPTVTPTRGRSLSPDELHFQNEHENQQLELVLMMTPYPTLLKFVVDGTAEEVSIVLSDTLEPSYMEGAIAKEIEKQLIDDHSLVSCIEDTLNNIGEMVLPSLPLPERQVQDPRSDTTTETPVPPQDDGSSRHSSSQAAASTHDRNSPTIRRQTHLYPEDDAITSSQYHGITAQYHPEQFQTPSTPQVQSSQRRQDTMQPGTVLYTSVPHQIPSDHIQPLPDESQLIKRGGNGSIFAGTMSGMTVAIKKTHYRSKEFAILTKIRHRNIMPLLAFILGEEIPTSRRRYYCYHIMPRLTGDCARLLTDKEEFTMKNLRRKHRENPRLLGLMQGNFKFIIREVLRGLSYLHAIHIAHRDIKGSNILLKFFCSCNNPLECACDIKYQVVITDYDAAVELDHEDKLLPSSSSSHTPQPQYHCVPVGTNGYRAPECSMHVVTNSPECFSPPVSTKCDLWSLGLLVYRMLVGNEGPYHQREMAILILRYHQIAGYVEGVSRRNIAHIDDYTLESVLQVCVCVCVCVLHN